MKVQMLFVTSVKIRFISIEVAVSIERVLLVNHPRIPHILFQNEKPRILLKKIINICINPP